MFKRNESNADRALRAILGIVLIGAYFAFPDLSWGWVLWIGIIPLATAITGFCPLYRLLGISTCRVAK